MKKNFIAFIMTIILVLSLFGCRGEEAQDHNAANMQAENSGETDTENTANAESGEENAGETEAVSEVDPNNETQPSEGSTVGGEQPDTENTATEEAGAPEDTLPFEAFRELQFLFSSGAGGWGTLLAIEEDGSFYGEYFDGDLGSTGEGHPNGTTYLSEFTGRFTQPVKVNEYTYSMQISELNYVQAPGNEGIIDGMLYCYTDAYGLSGAQDILIYLPGAPLAELPGEFRSWVGYYDLSMTTETELPFYALHNVAEQYGFSSYNVIDNLKSNMEWIEERADAIAASIKNDPLTQTEYNEQSQQLYEIWDSALNSVWAVLIQISDDETEQTLTKEQLEWIAMKEQAVAEAGAEVEGGSMQSMAMNMEAAELTEIRVYELLELLE